MTTLTPSSTGMLMSSTIASGRVSVALRKASAPSTAVAVLKAANIDAHGGETLDAIGKRAGLGGPGIASLLVTSQER